LTILKKRKGYKNAFANFDPHVVSTFTAQDIDRLTTDGSIIRNRQKIAAAVNNAQKFLAIQQAFGTFDTYLWSFVDNTPIVNNFHIGEQLPATSLHSDALSKDLKGRGFSFLGSTIMYAHMQAMGLVNDHVFECFKRKLI